MLQNRSVWEQEHQICTQLLMNAEQKVLAASQLPNAGPV
jgi:hypothetical protein